MKRSGDGSAIIALLLILSAGMICSLGLWKSSLLMFDVIHNKELYYQHQYAAHGLLLCGCSLASYNRTALIRERGKQAIVTFSQWPITDTKIGCGVITITATSTTEITVHSSLRIDNQEVCALTCTVRIPTTQGDTHDFLLPATLSDWSIFHS